MAKLCCLVNRKYKCDHCHLAFCSECGDKRRKKHPIPYGGVLKACTDRDVDMSPDGHWLQAVASSKESVQELPG